jgi:hypothetical protein
MLGPVVVVVGEAGEVIEGHFAEDGMMMMNVE